MMNNDDKQYRLFVKRNKERIEQNKQSSYTYDLQIFDDDSRFTLSLPPTTHLIEDDFNNFHKRKGLYISLEKGEVFDWLCEVHQEIIESQETKI